MSPITAAEHVVMAIVPSTYIVRLVMTVPIVWIMVLACVDGFLLDVSLAARIRGLYVEFYDEYKMSQTSVRKS